MGVGFFGRGWWWDGRRWVGRGLEKTVGGEERTKWRKTAEDGSCMIERRGRRNTLACGMEEQTGRHSGGVSKVLL